MNLNVSKPYKPLYTSITPQIRYVLLEGGRAGGRSFEATQLALFLLVTKQYLRGAVMREVKETIKDSVWQDLLDRIDENNLRDYFHITESPLQIKLGNKSISAKAFKASSKNQTAKMKSMAGFNFILIEEAEEINEEDFTNLDVTLRKIGVDILIVLAFNPPVKGHFILNKFFDLIPSEHEGYYHCKLKRERQEDTIHIHSTYKDNFKNLNKSTISILESYKTSKPDYYKHMILGLVPSLKTGLIFKKWDTCTEEEYFNLPYQPRLGMDFGFNDPATLEEVKVNENNIWIHERLYERHLDFDQLFEKVQEFKNQKIVGDSSAKTLIITLSARGLWLESSIKGADSVYAGIQWILGKNIHITETSHGIIEETLNYSWLPDKNKVPTDKPEDANNHGWDAVRYATEDLQTNQDFRSLYGY
jgi:phage terminase large subunit